MSKKKIVIIGGGATGWTVASLLRKQLPAELVCIQLVDDSRKEMGCADASHSAIHGFHDLIGLHEKTCIVESSATFSLGLLYKSWSFSSQYYALAEGAYGAPLDGVEFQQLFAKASALNFPGTLDDYSINATAAKLSRFGHPVSDPQSIYSTIKYGLNVDLNSYAEVLKRHALQLGVEIFNADCVAVELNEIDGNIASISLSNGHIVSADLFIDCSGEASVLLGSALRVNEIEAELAPLFDSLAFGCNRYSGAVKSAATVEHGNYGYLKKIPLKDKEAVSYYFSSEITSKDNIEEEMLRLGVTDVQFSAAGFKRKETFWVKNCLAIGESALSFYDIYLSPLHIVRNSIVRFLDLLVDFDNLDVSRREYNRLSIIEFERIHELVELQFYVAKDKSDIFRQYFAKNKLSDNAQHRLDLFGLVGRHSHFDGSVVSDTEWAAFFMGNGVLPKTYSLDADGVDENKLMSFTEKLRTVIHKAAEYMPNQKDYIAQITVAK